MTTLVQVFHKEQLLVFVMWKNCCILGKTVVYYKMNRGHFQCF